LKNILLVTILSQYNLTEEVNECRMARKVELMLCGPKDFPKETDSGSYYNSRTGGRRGRYPLPRSGKRNEWETPLN